MNEQPIFDAILTERDRQRGMWNRTHDWGSGDCSSSLLDEKVKLAVLLEEVGEVARALLEGHSDQMREELIQVAAVAVAWLSTSDDPQLPL
jgi:hypothetical protein